MFESTVLTHEVPEGWYPDPVNPQLQRWWAGLQWTEHVRHWEGSVQPYLGPEVPFGTQQPVAELPSFTAQLSLLAQPDTMQSSYLDGRPIPTTTAPWDVVETDPGLTSYVPMTNRYSAAATGKEAWSRRAYSPSTMSIWVLALTPLLWLGAQWLAFEWLVSTAAAADDVTAASLAILGGSLAVAVLAAAADSRHLARTMSTPSFAWILLGAVPYFVARWVVLRRQGLSFAAPGITFLFVLAASAAVWIFVLGPTALI